MLLAAVISPVVKPILGVGPQTPAVAAVLRTASSVAARQSAHSLHVGQFAFTRSTGAYFDEMAGASGTWGALVRTEREAWIGADGSGRIRQVSEAPVFLTPADRSRWQQAGAPPLTDLSRGETYDQRFRPGQLSSPLGGDGLNEHEVLTLESDVAGLRGLIQAAAERARNPLGYEMLTIVGDLLSETASPPPLRASLYQVAADIPGIELLGPTADRAGRRGIAVAAGRGATQLELVFDPKTSILLEKAETLVHPLPDTSAPAGTVIAYTLYLRSDVTSSLTAPKPVPRSNL